MLIHFNNKFFTHKRRINAVFIFIYWLFAQPVLADIQKPLRILLTNDDGYQAVGITTMKQALESNGHKVTVVAPLTQRSGSSASISVTIPSYKQINSDVWAVDATPLTCVWVGLTTILAQTPDLIVSGTNIGANLGPVAVLSGTVGGALAGVHAELAGLPGSIPAIAFNTDAPMKETKDPGGFKQHFQNVAAFAVRIIELLAEGDGPLLPERTMLNVNYPPLLPKDIKGVRQMTQGNNINIKITYERRKHEGEEIIAIKLDPVDGINIEQQSDSVVTAHSNGFITIVPMDGDYTADSQVQKQVQSRLKGLEW